MIVLTVTNCPPSLRGDITSWLFEIDTGIYIGRLSGRVRDALWERVCEHVKSGRATMVYSARNEQGFLFKVHNAQWQIRDYDGLQLMNHPIKQETILQQATQQVISKAERYQKAKAIQRHQARQQSTRQLLVFDLETTGLDPARDSILEIGAIQIVGGKPVASFQLLIRQTSPVPQHILKLTGLSEAVLIEQGVELKNALEQFLEFVGSLPAIAHNADFDLGFLRLACQKLGLPMFRSEVTDTCALAKRLVEDTEDFKLKTLAAHFDIRIETMHRSLPDCETTYAVYRKLIELQQGLI